MLIEVARLLLGLSIALFYRPIASTILQQERVLDTYFRRRGLNLPSPLSDRTAQNLYFYIGVAICLLEAIRIWTMLPA
ncbi:MAG TPA: hypothetical protein VKW06_03770 [Candidatus Angelobacter sp.]|nr:hypothetical protein [Candidatus Angelobacter sp.]